MKTYRTVGLALLVVLLGAATRGDAQAPTLRVDLAPCVVRPRTSGPLPVDVQLRWDGAGLLEGTLEMEFRDGNRVIGRYRSAELALAAGEVRHRLLLPAMLPSYDPQVEVRMWFVTGGDRHALASQFLMLSKAGERSLVMAVCAGGGMPPDRMRALEQSLRLERFGHEVTNAPPAREFMTMPARLEVDDLPVQPLAYCAYDLVVLTAESLNAMNERQAQALGSWLRAGGSLAVLADNRIADERLGFLNGLHETDTRFATDAEGRLQPAGIHRLHAGLGRLVIVAQPFDPGADSDSAIWRSAVAFLWKVRKDASESIRLNGHWEDRQGTREDYDAAYRRGPEFYVAGDSSGGEPGRVANAALLPGMLAELLMPRNVRPVPFAALSGLLALFIVAIGPGEWFLLGWLKCRRWTWLTFPALSVLFAIGMVKLANDFLGQHDQRRALVVVDVGAGGSVLRQNRFELVFAGRDRAFVEEWRGALWSSLGGDVMPSPMTMGGVYGGLSYSQRRALYAAQRGALYAAQRASGLYSTSGMGFYSQPSAGVDGGGEETYRIEGSFPARFRIARALRQWQPRLSRVFSLEPPPGAPLQIRWDVLERHVRGGGGVTVPPSDGVIDGDRRGVGLYVCRGGRCNALWPTPAMPNQMIEHLNWSTGEGLLNVVSQFAPTGGRAVEDLAVADLSDAGSCTFAFVTSSGEDIVVYRRTFHGSE